MATLFFVCINGVEKEEGLRCIDNFGGLPTRTIYDMEHRVTIPCQRMASITAAPLRAPVKCQFIRPIWGIGFGNPNNEGSD